MHMPRLVFYCHNVSGLGHIVRTGQVAAAAARAGGDCTLITGCRFIGSLEFDPAVALELLPPARLENGVTYVGCDPALEGADIIELRASRILELVRRIEPDVVLVDHNPVGLGGELLPTLIAAAAERWATRFVWGIAYLEGTAVGRRPPGNPRIREAIGHYHAAIAYSEPGDLPLLDDCPAWAIPSRAAYVGTVAAPPLPPLPREDGLAVVVAGGGSTALELWRDVIEARRLLPASERLRLRFVVGPMGDADRIAALAAGETDVDVRATSTVAEAVRDAHVVIARSGYNTAAALLRTALPIVFVPVTGISRDQVTRAARLAGRPGVWVVSHGDAAARPAAIAEALRAARACDPVDRTGAASDGAANAAAMVLTLALEVQAERG